MRTLPQMVLIVGVVATGLLSVGYSKFDEGAPSSTPLDSKTPVSVSEKTGKYAINPIYEDAKDFAYGLAAVRVNGMWGYLRKPIKAVGYARKYSVSKENLSKAIALGKIRGVLSGDVLWVQDREIS